MATLLKRKHESSEYRHKKFDVSKRMRLDSSSSSASSVEVDVCSIDEAGSSEPLLTACSIFPPPSDKFEKHEGLKRSCPTQDDIVEIIEDIALQPPKKRKCFIAGNNDSGVFETTQCSNSVTPFTPQPRLTSTPRIVEVKKISVVTPSLKRRFATVEETNDSGVSLIQRNNGDEYDTNDDLLSVASCAPLTPLHSRYTSTPLQELSDVAATPSPFKRQRVYSNASSISAIPAHIVAESSRYKSNPIDRVATNTWQPRYTSTPLEVLAAVASTAAPTIAIAPTIAASPNAALPFYTNAAPTSTATRSMPRISDETMHSICRYHENMVRKFPKKERSPKDQERRDKNTIACRVSRRLKKLESVAIEEQYKEFSRQHLEIVEASVRAAAYLNALTLRLAAIGAGRWKYGAAATQHSENGLDVKPTISKNAVLRPTKPFSIAFLTGQDGNE